MKYCMHCGAKLPDNALYCKKCGAPVDYDDDEKDEAIAVGHNEKLSVSRADIVGYVVEDDYSTNPVSNEETGINKSLTGIDKNNKSNPISNSPSNNGIILVLLIALVALIGVCVFLISNKTVDEITVKDEKGSNYRDIDDFDAYDSGYEGMIDSFVTNVKKGHGLVSIDSLDNSIIMTWYGQDRSKLEYKEKNNNANDTIPLKSLLSFNDAKNSFSYGHNDALLDIQETYSGNYAYYDDVIRSYDFNEISKSDRRVLKKLINKSLVKVGYEYIGDKYRQCK